MLHRALRAADSASEPMLTFDIRHIYARILRSLSHEDRAQQQAMLALAMAVKHGWEYRARWIRDEFGIHASLDHSSQQSRGVAERHSTSEGSVLVPHSGRDVDGNDLRELSNCSSTLVDQVWRTGEALIVTGSEQGAALGSQSAVIHGLRSILVAPLQLKGRTLGVV